MIAILKLTAQGHADIVVRGLMERGGLVPVGIDGQSWDGVIEERTEADGVAEYRIRQIETCLCGKPMHPLPFDCRECGAVGFQLQITEIKLCDT